MKHEMKSNIGRLAVEKASLNNNIINNNRNINCLLYSVQWL